MARYAFFALFLVLLSGCRWAAKPTYVPELGKGSENPAANSGFEHAGCLDNSGEAIAGYFLGTSGPKPFVAVLDCASEMLDLFTTRIHGSQDGVYLMSELRDFLQTYFLKSSKISPRYYIELLTLKRAILGGTEDGLTHAEIRRAQDFIFRLKDGVHRLAPFMPLSSRSAAQWDTPQLKLATQTLKAVIQDLGDFLTVTAQPYSFTHLETLLQEFMRLFPALRDDDLVPLLVKRLPWMRALKRVLVDRQPDVIGPDAWRIVSSVGAESYAIFLQLTHLQAKHSDWSRNPGRELFMDMMRRLIVLLTQAADRNTDQRIFFEDLDVLIDEFPFSTGIQKSTIRRTLRPLVNRLLSTSPGRIYSGVSAAALAKLLDQLEIWNGFQGAIDTGTEPPLKDSKLHGLWRDLTQDPRFNRWHFSPNGQIAFSRRAWERPAPIFDLSQKAWILLLSRAMAYGYGGSRGLLTREMLKQGMREFAPVLIDFKILDPNWDPNFVDGQFEQMDLIHWNSDGDGSANEIELFEHLASAVSMGGWVQETGDKILPICTTGRCARLTLAAHAESYFRNYPELLEEFTAKNPGQQSEYLELLERIATGRFDGPLRATWDLGVFQSLAMLMHYIEFVLHRYDTSEDGWISEPELRASDSVLARFVQQTLRNALKDPKRNDTPETLHTLVGFVLANGRTPAPLEIFEWLARPSVRYDKVRAGRIELLRAIIGAYRGAR